MKNLIKNFVVTLIVGGLFFVPVFSYAQISGEGVVDNNNTPSPQFNDDKSQAEIEAMEDIQIREPKSKFRRLFVRKSKKTKNRVFASFSSSLYMDRSQAELEAAEELFNIHIISDYRKSKSIDPIQVNNDQVSKISEFMALNYNEKNSAKQNLR